MNLRLCRTCSSGETPGPIRKEGSLNQTAAGTQKVEAASGTHMACKKAEPHIRLEQGQEPGLSNFRALTLPHL